jgi:DNA-binding NtrC family response regulator
LPRIESKLEPEIKKLQAIPRGNEKILLVDDDPALADLGGKLLTILGYGVTTFTDPHLALSQFNSNPTLFDLVITDLIMPGLTGEKLADEILNHCPEMPIIVSTGFSDRIRMEHIEKSGVKGILHKPITLYQLARVIRQVLDGQTVDQQP